jgi:RNA polymerase sigma factor (sigma-70 family)
VHAAARGDHDAWNVLVERFAPVVWAIARRHRLNPTDAADVFQTTWLRLLEHLDHIKQPERVGAWLATTTCRECLRMLRLTGRQVASGDDFDVRADLATWERFDEDIVAGERSRLVDELVKGLPVRSQTLLRLLTTDPPLSYRDISASMSMPIGSIGPTRARALEQLRRLAIAAGVSPEDVLFS